MNIMTTPTGVQSVKSKELAKLLRRALISASTDEARANLCHIRLEPARVWTDAGPNSRTETDGVRLISTDGHRLSVIESDIFWVGAPLELHYRAIEALLLLCKHAEHVAIDEESGSFYAAGMTVRYLVPDTINFPPWTQVVPAGVAKHSAKIKRSKLSRLIKATEPRRPADVEPIPTIAFGPLETAGGTALDDDGQLGVFSNTKYGAFISKAYLLDALKLFDAGDELYVRMNHELDPIVIEHAEGGTKTIIMPRRG
jgi:hypothetical protein